MEMGILLPRRSELTHRDGNRLDPRGARIEGLSVCSGRTRHLRQVCRYRRGWMLVRAWKTCKELKTQQGQASQEESVAFRGRSDGSKP